MILDNTASKVDTNLDNSTRLSFKNNPKIFRLFSDNLYSNKIGSIVRELSSNARDSHILAKNKDPFDIHIPTLLDPTFRIKDYGVGMSKRDVIEIFSCYGESTKTETNDFAGAFGLGSKTPLCYSSSYNITSIHNNEKTSYVIYLDSNGYPSITELYSVKTIEKNGFEVFFGVDENDFNKFKNEVQIQLKYFDVPYLLNGKLVEPHKFTDPMFSTKDFDVFKHWAGYIYCIFGGISYSIDKSKIDEKINNFEIYLNFDVGEIDVSVSREDISYTKKTINNINNKIVSAKKYIINYIENNLDQTYKYDYDVDVNIQFGNTWIIDYLGVGKEKIIYPEKYESLRFYVDSKRTKNGIRIRMDRPYFFNIWNNKKRILIKDIIKMVYINKVFIIPDFSKEKYDIQTDLNQFIMDLDSKKYVKFISEDDIDFSDMEIEKDKSEIEYREIYIKDSPFGEIQYIKWIKEKIDKGEKFVWFIKYKGQIIDENKNVFMEYNIQNITRFTIDDLTSTTPICFTLAEFKKFKKSEYFNLCQNGIDYINERIKYYIDNIDNYDIFSSDNIINNSICQSIDVSKIQDTNLKNYILNTKLNKLKKDINPYLKTFMRSENKLFKYEFEKEFQKQLDKYNKFKEMYGIIGYIGYGGDNYPEDIVNIINMLYLTKK